MFFIFFLDTECYCSNDISLEWIFKFIFYNIIYEFKKEGSICFFTNIIIWYLFSVLENFFNRATMLVFSDVNDITCKASKVIKSIQLVKWVKKK